jgi:DNA mismatch repair protein MutS2
MQRSFFIYRSPPPSQQSLMQYTISEQVTSVLEWDKIIDAIESRVTSGPGKEFCRGITPLDESQARARLALITELKEALLQGKWCDFSGLYDITKLALRASKRSTLSITELFSVRETVRSFSRIRSWFVSHSEYLPLCSGAASAIDPLSELTDTLTRAFRDDGEINGATYPQIGRIERAINDAKQSIERALSKIIHSTHMEDVLQEKIHTLRGERYVVLVKANMKGRLKGTVMDISSSSATLFVEPEAIAPLNDELLMRRAELEREIEKILATLSEIAGAYHAELSANLAIALYLDFLQGAAKFSRDTKSAAPVITDEPVIELFSARHPLLQLMIGERNIANDVTIGKKYSCLLITGANTGGKTVLLKTIGLASLCASHGLHVTASPDSQIGLFTSIMADIGDDQSLEKNLSTFSGQVVKLNEMLDTCNERSLVLLDEIMAGTNPRHGAALAQSILESFADKRAKVAVTTHYPELRNLAPHDPRFRNASVSFNIETLKPTYELMTGIPGASFTFEIASKYGMNETIISRAKEITSGDELSTEALIEKINKYREEIETEKNEAEKLKNELLAGKARYEEMQKLLKDETRRVKRGENLAFLEDLRAFRDKASEKIRALQNADMKKASVIQKELADMEKNISATLNSLTRETLSETHRSPYELRIEPGLTVVVIPLEKEGTIEECNDEKRIAVVRLGNIFSRYSYDDLLIPEKGKESPQAKKPAYKPYSARDSGSIPVTVQTAHNTIDLRGMRVDEALFVMDESLDRMMRSNISSAVIIHGHGTGALKEAVRTRLKRSPYVSGFRPGEQSEGGDGVSVVMIS